MKSESMMLLNKANRAITAAEILLENNQSEFATGQAYYAIFYIWRHY